MALTDINFQEGDGQDFNVEIPTAIYSGNVSDITQEGGGNGHLLYEIHGTQNTNGNIFIMSE